MVNRIRPAALLLAAGAFAQAPAGDSIPADFLLAERTASSWIRAMKRGVLRRMPFVSSSVA